MGLLKKFAGYLGFGHHNDNNNHDSKIEDDDHNNYPNYNNNNSNSDDIRRNRMNIDPVPVGPRRGFGVQVQVPVERPVVGPILLPCTGNAGGVQGLRWYAARLKTDEDGDVADEFLYEVSPDKSSIPQDDVKSLPRFQVKTNAKRAVIKNQSLTPDGKLQHYVDCQGQLKWV